MMLLKNHRSLQLFTWAILALLLAGLGTYIELDAVSVSKALGQNSSFIAIALFFAVLNLNAILLFVFVFLTFRSGVKLIVERRNEVFGSMLRTKLVTSFLFFSLLPTVILLYMSTKFVNANFEKWLPSSLLKTTELSVESEGKYQEKILTLLKETEAVENIKTTFDFVYNPVTSKFVHFSPGEQELRTQVLSVLKRPLERDAKWYVLTPENKVAIKTSKDGMVFGIISPATLSSQWKTVTEEFHDAKPGIQMLRLSYYVMLGVLTLLIVFSATWLGFTIAREFTIPLQILAAATELVAQGDYAVHIDDIVADDEIGRLALSFRSMVADLCTAKVAADKASAEIHQKAEEISQKSEYNEILLRNIHASVISVDENGYILSWNEQAEILFHTSEKRAYGKTLIQCLETHFFQKAIQPMLFELNVLQKSRVVGEFSGIIAGKDSQIQITASVLASSQGKLGTVIFINDLTELAKAQRLAAWRDVARRVAHEIKNPLTPIKLGAQRLEKRFKGKFEAEELSVFEECIKVILHSSESIRVLVDEFIRYARMPQATFQEGNIIEALQISVAGFAENSEHVSVRLEIVESSETTEDETFLHSGNVFRLVAHFDRDQIVRVFINLIGNAVAASAGSDSEVVVRVVHLKSRNLLRIQVMDWGNGVPDEVKAKIFEPYFSTKRAGTGLGLVIARQIVHEHKGTLTLQDNSPRGSIFTVDLPLALGHLRAL